MKLIFLVVERISSISLFRGSRCLRVLSIMIQKACDACISAILCRVVATVPVVLYKVLMERRALILI